MCSCSRGICRNQGSSCAPLAFFYYYYYCLTTSSTNLSQLEAASVIPNLCIFVLQKLKLLRFNFFFFIFPRECGSGKSNDIVSEKKALFFAVGKKALSCWSVPCVSCLRRSLVTRPGSEIVDLKTDTLICEECLDDLEKIYYSDS